MLLPTLLCKLIEREKVAALKLELQRACVGDVDGGIQEQAQLLADAELSLLLQHPMRWWLKVRHANSSAEVNELLQ